MISVEEAFDTFRSRLELSKTEQADASRRQTDVRNCICAEFDIEDDFLTGSYARHTKTKPLKDVDIFFCLGPDDKHWRDKPPIKVLRRFESVLSKEFEFLTKRLDGIEGRMMTILDVIVVIGVFGGAIALGIGIADRKGNAPPPSAT